MSGLRGSFHGGNGIWSGVLRECSFSKCCWIMCIICVGCVLISFLIGSRIDSSLGWSFALGWSPEAVLRLLWYRLGLFLYCLSSFFAERVSLRLALLMIEAMALWHNAGMSSSLGVSVSRSTSLAFVCVCVIR